MNNTHTPRAARILQHAADIQQANRAMNFYAKSGLFIFSLLFVGIFLLAVVASVAPVP